MGEVKIRPTRPEEVEELWEIGFSDPRAEWTKFNGPYFNQKLPTKEEFVSVLAYKNWINRPNRLLITYDDQIVGSVGAGFEDGDLHRWLDMGIIVYRSDLWDQQIGSRALKLFIDYLFKLYDLPHLGLTTWSGNPRMMHVAQKVGMKQEACIRQVRYYHDQYYDSVKYGILRNEWKDLKKQ
ncbi:GNAT family N-acetyltransferase [Companilactobacillus sp. FL22-1]|uniref:GNAT family N-acetyltransferase n=1 Tax=Companilactobacillus sp. FL22-1 TaxID=3373892 RepID=UPI0037540FF2